ncbi:hypothetical protein OGAPHI_001746 [Ogataea philodendri]|uniref:Uncharacterized protein n=1 Tax=Ogataea philodendri TaxID=1378263 RepID=A0A9P8PAX0_9ASCO|nr:uncharacterized protein OGAPHI_001746 [Ogataea philodendri]KAH3667992.1 hypothetical protein OGAPHI_001746 [Ogataea philodendri]
MVSENSDLSFTLNSLPESKEYLTEESLDILLVDAGDVCHQVSDVSSGVGELFLDVVRGQDLVHGSQHTRNVLMDVQDSDDVLLVEVEATERDFWEVDGSNGRTFVDVAGQGSSDFDTNGTLGLLGGASDVRSEDHVLQRLQLGDPRVQVVGEQWTVLGWLVRIHVQSSTREFSELEGVDQRWDVDNGSSGIVQQVGTVLHGGQLWRGDHVLGLCGFRNVQSDKVGACQQLVQSRHLFGSTKSHDHQDVVVDHVHTKGLGKHRQLRANVAVTNNTKGLASDLPALGADLVPDAVVELGGTVTQLSGQGDDLTNDKLCNRPRVGERRVEHGDTGIGRKLKVDLVGSNTETANDTKVLGVFQNVGCQLGLGTDTNSMHVLDLLDQVLFSKRGLVELDLVALGVEDVDGCLVDVFQKQDFDVTGGKWLQGLGGLGDRKRSGAHLVHVRHGRRGGDRVGRGDARTFQRVAQGGDRDGRGH